jgi:hypothetical protein
MVIPADLDRLALHREQLRHNRFLIAREGPGNRDKLGLQGGILVLRGELLGPVEREIKVAAAVVDRAELASGGAVFFEKFMVLGYLLRAVDQSPFRHPNHSAPKSPRKPFFFPRGKTVERAFTTAWAMRS